MNGGFPVSHCGLKTLDFNQDKKPLTPMTSRLYTKQNLPYAEVML